MSVGSPPDLGEFTGFGMEYGIGDNGVLYCETKSGEKVLLRWDAANPSSTLNLERLNAGVILKARARSHMITMVLAVLWTTLSIAILI